MNRRRFLSVSGSALLGGTATISNNQPVIGLDFSIDGVSNEDASDTDNIVVEFSKLRLTPYYLETSQTDVIITVDLSGGYSDTREERFEINLVNGETSKLVEDNIVDSILIPVGSVTGGFIQGNVTVEVSNEKISRSYSQSFVISDGVDSSGGTVTRKSIDGKEYRIHSFERGESDNKFSVEKDTKVDILAVGGGGGGGGENSGVDSGGGGGGGGIVYKESYEVSSSREYEVSVGDGGKGGNPNNPTNDTDVSGLRGEDTVFGVATDEIVAYGGGGGACGCNSRDAPTYSSYGGGGGGSSGNDTGAGAPATSQGNAGGRGSDDSNPQPEDGESDGKLAGGGGGGTRPDEFHQSTAGDGGDGGDYGDIFTEDFGEDGYFAGGGGGTESVERGGSTDNGTGGKGGGGDGRTGGGQDGTDGTGGGGGAGDDDSFGGKGGSGIVLVRVGPL